MQRAKLTNGAVEKFQCREGRQQDVLWDAELKGFGLRLSASAGTRTYFLQYRVKGTRRERQVTIGRHNDPYRVDQARAKAIEIKGKMLNGIDPVAEAERKDAEKREQDQLSVSRNATLKQCLDSYLTHKRTKHGELRPATKADMRRSIETYLKDWLDKPIANLNRDKCLARFVELSQRAKTCANLTFVYLRAVCNYARDLYADDQGNYTILATNPVSRMLKIQKLNREKPRTRRIPLDRIGHVWLALQKLRECARTTGDRTAADLVCTRLLTGLRLTESGSLRWSQIDLEKRTIHLLGDVNKSHQDVVMPMSGTLHALLSARAALAHLSPRAREYVFQSPNETSAVPFMRDPDATMKVVSKAARLKVTSHDFRRTLEDLAKAVKVDADDRRKLLVHLAGDVHGAHYDNSPDPEALRQAVEAIARFVIDAAAVAEAMESGRNVVPFTTAAAA